LSPYEAHVASMSNPRDFEDIINAPKHYKSASGLEAITVIEDFGLGFRLGNCLKYLLRAGKKGDRLEDLRKARWYLEREIARTEKAACVEKPKFAAGDMPAQVQDLGGGTFIRK
jgi:hypothetical protein